MRARALILVGFFILSNFVPVNGQAVDAPYFTYEPFEQFSNMGTIYYNTSIEQNGSPYDEFGFKVFDGDQFLPNLNLTNGDQLTFEISDPTVLPSVQYPYQFRGSELEINTSSVNTLDALRFAKNNQAVKFPTMESLDLFTFLLPSISLDADGGMLSISQVLTSGIEMPQLGISSLTYDSSSFTSVWVNNTLEAYYQWDRNTGLLNNMTIVDKTNAAGAVTFSLTQESDLDFIRYGHLAQGQNFEFSFSGWPAILGDFFNPVNDPPVVFDTTVSSRIRVSFNENIADLQLRVQNGNVSTEQRLQDYVSLTVNNRAYESSKAPGLLANLILPQFISPGPCTWENPCDNSTRILGVAQSILPSIGFGNPQEGTPATVDVLADGRIYYKIIVDDKNTSLTSLYTPYGQLIEVIVGQEGSRVTVLRSRASHLLMSFDPTTADQAYSWKVGNDFSASVTNSPAYQKLSIKNNSLIELKVDASVDKYQLSMQTNTSRRAPLHLSETTNPFTFLIDGKEFDAALTVVLQFLLPSIITPIIMDTNGTVYHFDPISFNSSLDDADIVQYLFGQNATMTTLDDGNALVHVTADDMLQGDFQYRIRKRPDLLQAEWDELIDESIELVNDNPLYQELTPLQSNPLYNLGTSYSLSMHGDHLTINGRNFGTRANVQMTILSDKFLEVRYSVAMLTLILSSDLEELSPEKLGLDYDFNELVKLEINDSIVDTNLYLGLVLKVFTPIVLEDGTLIFTNIDLQNQLQKSAEANGFGVAVSVSGDGQRVVVSSSTQTNTFEFNGDGLLDVLLVDKSNSPITIDFVTEPISSTTPSATDTASDATTPDLSLPFNFGYFVIALALLALPQILIRKRLY